MNLNELERYVEIIKKNYPTIHIQTINMINFQNTVINKKIELGD